MARVPVFRSDRRASPVNLPKASAASFGGAIANGLAELGDGAFDLAEGLHAIEMKQLAADAAEQEARREKVEHSQERISAASDRLSTGYNDANVVNASLKIITAETWAQAEAAGLPKTEIENSVREAQNGALSIIAGHSKEDISRQIHSEPENAEKILERKMPIPLDHGEKEQLRTSAAALTEVRTDLSEQHGHQEVTVLESEAVRVLKSISDEGDAAGFRDLEAMAKGTALEPIVASGISVEENLLPFDAKTLSGMSQISQEIRDGEVSAENRKAVDRLERSLDQNLADRYEHVFSRILAGEKSEFEADLLEEVDGRIHADVLRKGILLRDSGLLNADEAQTLRKELEVLIRTEEISVRADVLIKLLDSRALASQALAQENFAEWVAQRYGDSDLLGAVMGNVSLEEPDTWEERIRRIDALAREHGISNPGYIDAKLNDRIIAKWESPLDDDRIELIDSLVDGLGEDRAFEYIRKSSNFGKDVEAIFLISSRSRHVAQPLLKGLRLKQLGLDISLPQGFLRKAYKDFAKNLVDFGEMEGEHFLELFKLKFLQKIADEHIDPELIADLIESQGVGVRGVKIPVGKIINETILKIGDYSEIISEVLGNRQHVGGQTTFVPKRFDPSKFLLVYKKSTMGDLGLKSPDVELTDGSVIPFAELHKLTGPVLVADGQFALRDQNGNFVSDPNRKDRPLVVDFDELQRKFDKRNPNVNPLTELEKILDDLTAEEFRNVRPLHWKIHKQLNQPQKRGRSILEKGEDVIKQREINRTLSTLGP